MPEDERQPAPGHLSGDEVAPGLTEDQAIELLERGTVEVEARLPWSSNQTFLVSVTGAGIEARAIYKPHEGERPLWDFPDGLHRREVAAYELSRRLGWDLVPPTVGREDAPFGTGSLQLFVDADYGQHYFTLFDEGGHEPELAAFCAFDEVANNADRKSGHVLVTRDGRLWGIDHGLCFHAHPKLRTVIWDFAGDRVPDRLLADLVRLAADLPEGLASLLRPDERRALVARIDALIGRGTFPVPDDSERPPYPWPLV